MLVMMSQELVKSAIAFLLNRNVIQNTIVSAEVLPVTAKNAHAVLLARNATTLQRDKFVLIVLPAEFVPKSQQDKNVRQLLQDRFVLIVLHVRNVQQLLLEKFVLIVRPAKCVVRALMVSNTVQL